MTPMAYMFARQGRANEGNASDDELTLRCAIAGSTCTDISGFGCLAWLVPMNTCPVTIIADSLRQILSNDSGNGAGLLGKSSWPLAIWVSERLITQEVCNVQCAVLCAAV